MLSLVTETRNILAKVFETLSIYFNSRDKVLTKITVKSSYLYLEFHNSPQTTLSKEEVARLSRVNLSVINSLTDGLSYSKRLPVNNLIPPHLESVLSKYVR